MPSSVRPHRRQPTRLCHPWDSPGKNTGVGCHFLLQCMKVKLLSRVWLFATPWTAAYQAPPSMGFARQEYWSGLPLPSPRSRLERTYLSSIHAMSLQSCPTLCDTMDCSLSGSSVHGIFQARVLKWGAIAFSVIRTQPHSKLVSIWPVTAFQLQRQSWVVTIQRLYSPQNA